jgi:PelA/Pel-15E family pectate lyase
MGDAVSSDDGAPAGGVAQTEGGADPTAATGTGGDEETATSAATDTGGAGEATGALGTVGAEGNTPETGATDDGETGDTEAGGTLDEGDATDTGNTGVSEVTDMGDAADTGDTGVAMGMGDTSDTGTAGTSEMGDAAESGNGGDDSAMGGTDGPLLSQNGNPVIEWFDGARTAWDLGTADIVLSYQQNNGGWPKNLDYGVPGSGGNEAGTFDNGATSTEAVYLAEVYNQTQDPKYRDAVHRAFEYMMDAQYPSGGWPQYYPLRDGYWDHVTFNDDAMAHVLIALHQAVEQVPPYDTDIFTDSDREEFRAAVAKGVEYILKAQWVQDGKLTVWCAQHGATDYLPKAARAYELESLSGSESAGVIAFLMVMPQTPEIETAVKAALDWYRSPDTYLDGYTYDTGQCPDGNPIIARSGARMWHRFYKLDTNRGFFSDRDGGTYYDLMEISQERRCGYRWAGNWGEEIMSYGESVGY